MVSIKHFFISFSVCVYQLNATSNSDQSMKEIAHVTREVVSKANSTLASIIPDDSRNVLVDHLKYVTPMVVMNQTEALHQELRAKGAPQTQIATKLLVMRYAQNSTDQIITELKTFSKSPERISKRSSTEKVAAASLAFALQSFLVMGSAALVIIAFIVLWNLISLFTAIISRLLGPMPPFFGGPGPIYPF
jgi:hypothetical protein